MSESVKIGLPMCVPESSHTRAEVCRFFAGLGVAEGPGLDRLVERVIPHCESLRGVAPASVAAWLLAVWIGGVLGHVSLRNPGAAPVQTARAAVLLAEAGQRWPGSLLADGPLPEELSSALLAALPQPVPRPMPLAMPEQPLVPAGIGRPRLTAWGLGAEQRS